jgi:hypothetical protein
VEVNSLLISGDKVFRKGDFIFVPGFAITFFDFRGAHAGLAGLTKKYARHKLTGV